MCLNVGKKLKFSEFHSQELGTNCPHWVSGLLLFNTKWATFQLYHRRERELFDEMMISFCTKPTNWIGFSKCSTLTHYPDSNQQISALKLLVWPDRDTTHYQPHPKWLCLFQTNFEDFHIIICYLFKGLHIYPVVLFVFLGGGGGGVEYCVLLIE